MSLPNQIVDAIKDSAAIATAATATGAAVWLDIVETGLGLLTMTLGLVLVIYRILIARRQWREGQQSAGEEE